MKLSDLEEQKFLKIYIRLKTKNNDNFDEKFCIQLMTKRAGLTQSTATKVWSYASNNQKKKLNQEEFYKILKYVAALQNGMKFEEINSEEIGNFLPSFPKSIKYFAQNQELYDSLNEEEKEEMQNSQEKLLLRGVPVEISKIMNENCNQNYSKNMSGHDDSEVFFDTFDSSDFKNQAQNHKNILPEIKESIQEVRVEEIDSQILQQREEFQENGYNFTLSGPNALEMLKPKKEPPINFQILNKEFVASISDVKSKESADISLIKSRRPLNESTDKVTFSLHFFHDMVHADSSPNKQQKTIKEVEIIEFFIKEHNYFDKPIYYKLRTKLINKEDFFDAERRFSDFKWLGDYLTSHPQYQGLILPKLPEKHSLSSKLNNILNYDFDFIKRRQKDLEQFLQDLIKNERFCDDNTLLGFLTMNEKDFKELKESNTDKTNYWSMLYSIHPTNFMENYHYMKTYLSVKCNQKFFSHRRNYDLKELEKLYSELQSKQKILTKLKEVITRIEDHRNKTISEILASFSRENKSAFQKAGFNCLDNWEEFLQYTFKNDKSIAPNIEDSYLKLLKEIIYKIEMSSIVYENILSEIDDYELKIQIRDGKTTDNATIETEIQSKKEKIRVMQENFLYNLKELAGKIDGNIGDICLGIESKSHEYWCNYLETLKGYSNC